MLQIRPNTPKFVSGWGSAPDPVGGAYDAPPNPLIAMCFAPSALVFDHLVLSSPPQLLDTGCAYAYIPREHTVRPLFSKKCKLKNWRKCGVSVTLA